MVLGMRSSLGWERRRGVWALTDQSAVLLWQLGIAWSSLAAVADAATGRRIVLSGLVLLGPLAVYFTGCWLRTALAGVWATGLVVVLGVPDGIWGSRLQLGLIAASVFVAAASTLALILTIRTCLSLTVTAFLATACGSAAKPPRPAVSVSRPVSCPQQYRNWMASSGLAQYRKLQADVQAVLTEEESGNSVAMRAAMNQLMPAVLGDGDIDPVPHCADPGKLYTQYVTSVYTAGDNAKKAKGLAGLQIAAKPLSGLKSLQSQLADEVDRVLAQP
jgi:hypothetical protein